MAVHLDHVNIFIL